MVEITHETPRLLVYIGETEAQVDYSGGNSPAANGMTVGAVYFADRIEIGSWSTTVYINGKNYNGLCFCEPEKYQQEHEVETK